MRGSSAFGLVDAALPHQFATRLDPFDTRPRLVVERDGRIVWLCGNASELLREPFPLRIDGGYLGACDQTRLILREFLEEVDSLGASSLLRGKDKRHWVVLRGWTIEGRIDQLGLIASLSVPHKGVVESGLARALKLTSAEARVLDSFAHMHPPREIAEQMAISLSTVRSHLKQIHCKARVESAVQLSQLVRSFCG